MHGLGDFIACEAYMTDAECNAIENIYFASSHRQHLESGIRWNELFPNLKTKQILFDGPWKIDAASGLPRNADYKHFLHFVDKTIDPFWISQELLDANTPAFCTDIFMHKTRKFQRSRIAAMNYDLPKHIGLPEKFVLIHPWSDEFRTHKRDFTDEDWEGVLGCLEKNNIMGVVVNKSRDYPPQHPQLLDLTNQTTIQETFAMAKASSYFMGCASFLHVFTPRVMPSKNIFIRSTFKHLTSRTGEFILYHAPASLTDLNFKTFPSLNFLKDYEL